MTRLSYLFTVAVALVLIAGCGKPQTETKPETKPDVVQSMNIPSGDMSNENAVEE